MQSRGRVDLDPVAWDEFTEAGGDPKSVLRFRC